MTYDEVAKQHELNEETSLRFVKYMRTRWGDPIDEDLRCKVTCAGEWAERFKEGIEYICSDREGNGVLYEIDKQGGEK